MRLRRRLLSAVVLGGIVVTAACGGRGVLPDEPGPDQGALVVRGAEMTGTLLHGLRTRVPTMTVTTGGACPAIIFRGRRSAGEQGEPSIYVDGTLMGNTCILEQIQSADVDYVEVYAGGAVPRRPGIRRNPFGTIIVQRIRR